jgi:putative membrane protein
MARPSQFSGPVLKDRARFLKKLVWVVTVLVLGLVVMMRSPEKIPVSSEAREMISNLPRVIAGINTLVAACLLAGLWSIFRKAYRAHQRWMTAALALSGIFLLCYVTYHFTTVETKFGDFDGDRTVSDEEKAMVGSARIVYLVILITHIIAAAVSFPFILLTFVHAWTRDFAKHRRLAPKVFVVWLFVAISGPVCYWMLKDYYPVSDAEMHRHLYE